MKLLVLNGSPRGNHGNTKAMLDAMTSCWSFDDIRIINLHDMKDEDSVKCQIEWSDMILIGLPMYIHGVPGSTQESLNKLFRSGELSKPIIYAVQFGFPEAYQARHIEEYLSIVGRLTGTNTVQVLVCPGLAGLIEAPRMYTAKINALKKAGNEIMKNGRASQACVDGLRGFEHTKGYRLAVQLIKEKTGLQDLIWDQIMKKNECFEDRWAKPIGNRQEG